MLYSRSRSNATPLIQGVLIALLITGLAVMVYGQSPTKPTIKNVPAPQTLASSGAEMFSAYCAVCHGKDARGNGPAAAALKKAPTDLTALTRNNGGKFPEMRVYSAIVGDSAVAAHGTKDMPVWGSIFHQMETSAGVDKMRLSNLTKYIASIQK